MKLNLWPKLTAAPASSWEADILRAEPLRESSLQSFRQGCQMWTQKLQSGPIPIHFLTEPTQTGSPCCRLRLSSRISTSSENGKVASSGQRQDRIASIKGLRQVN